MAAGVRALPCSAHPASSAVAACHRCGARLCGDCFRLLADGQPCCDACAVELTSGPPSRWPFAVAFTGIALALCFGGYRLGPSLVLWIPVAVVGLIIAIFVGATGPSATDAPRPTLTEREPELEPSQALFDRAAHPYRTRVARAARRVVPLSGRSTAVVMTGAFILSAVVLPLGLGLPRWIEAELVLAVWWLGVGTLLSVLLYTGRRLAEDHRFKLELPKLQGSKGGPEVGKVGADVGCADAAGCGEGLVIVAVLVIAALAAWLLVEIVVPILVFGVYYFVIKALARVARDRHDCRGRAGRALFWGFAWASLYLVPLAAMIGLIQAAFRMRAS